MTDTHYKLFKKYAETQNAYMIYSVFVMHENLILHFPSYLYCNFQTGIFISPFCADIRP